MSGLNGQTESNQENIAFSSLLTYRPTRRERKKKKKGGKGKRDEVREEASQTGEVAGKKKAKRRKVGDEAGRGSLHAPTRSYFLLFRMML